MTRFLYVQTLVMFNLGIIPIPAVVPLLSESHVGRIRQRHHFNFCVYRRCQSQQLISLSSKQESPSFVPIESNTTVIGNSQAESEKSNKSFVTISLLDAQNGTNESQDSMVFTMMALIFMVGSLSSLDRVAMSIALVPMSEEMAMSDTLKGSISSFFSIGYGLGILPAGLLLSRLSPRFIMAVGICLWSLGTIGTPLLQSNMNLLLGARMLVGASESVVIPTIQRLLSAWIPPEKKSLAVAVVFCGFQTGTILAFSLSPWIIDLLDDWRSVFYVYGSAGLLFLIPWLSLAKDSPASAEIETTMTDRQKIDEQTCYEKEKTQLTTLDNVKNILMSAPWSGFVESKATWAMFLAHAANNWGLYNNLSWTPTFYSEQYGLNVKESAVLLIVPSIAGAIGGLSSGKIADAIIQNLSIPTEEAITNVRRIFQGLALFGPALCLSVLALGIPDEPWVAQTLFAAAVGMQSFNAAGYGAANQEKAGPKWTGLLYSVTSLPSVVIGTLGVQLTGIILDATEQNWSIVFAINAAIYIVGALAFIVLYDSRKEFD